METRGFMQEMAPSGQPGAIMRAVMAAVWRRRWLVAVFAALGLLLGIFQLHRLPRIYTVTLRVASVALEQSPTGRSGVDRFNSLAALAGVSLPSTGNGIGFELYQAGLTGRPAAEVLARRPEFMRRMFAAEWDEENQQWREPHGMLSDVRKAFGSAIGATSVPWHPPDAARVQDALSSMITVQKNQLSPVVTISIRTTDPVWGEQLLADLHQAVDGALREKTRIRATRYIDYLNRELAGTTIGDVRASLISTLIDQERQRMLASSNLDFAADPLERPVASSAPTSPNTLQVLIIYILFGAFMGSAAAFLLERFDMRVLDVWNRAVGVFGRRRFGDSDSGVLETPPGQ
jgi:hypothetical protein